MNRTLRVMDGRDRRRQVPVLTLPLAVVRRHDLSDDVDSLRALLQGTIDARACGPSAP